MLFRPKFCSNCGDKIERSEWRLWTSRRFCEPCASEFVGTEWLPRVAVVGGLLFLMIGIGGAFNNSTRQSETLAARQIKNSALPSASQTPAATPMPRTLSVQETNVSQVRGNTATGSNAVETPKIAAPEKPVREEPVYFCGAATKKGTPCSRRVKGNVRCFQHTGMPPMLPPDKLRVS